MRHVTRYAYDDDVRLCHNEAHLVLRDAPGQVVRSSSLAIDPAPGDIEERLDVYGNRVTYFSVDAPHRNLVVTATSVVDVAPADDDGAGALAGGSVAWDAVRQRLAAGTTPEDRMLVEWTLPSPLVPQLDASARYASPSFTPGRPLLDAVEDLVARIHDDFAFDPHVTTTATPLATVLADRRGVCQDFAHIAVGCLRAMGLAARYVSGYLETDPPEGQQRLTGADASHAWCSVWVPEGTWVDVDPTNDVRPSDRHVTIGWGRDYGDVTPLRGVVFSGGGAHMLAVEVDVLRMDTATEA